MNNPRNSGYVAALAAGILLMISPRTTTNLIAILIGLFVLAGGAMAIYNEVRFGTKLYGSIISGIIRVLLGAYIVARPASVLSIFPTLFGIYLVVEGVTGLTYSDTKFTSILTLVIGAVMIFNPLHALNTAVFWCGALMTGYAIVGLIRVNGFGSNY